MDLEERFQLVKGIGEEVITEEELRQLLEEKEHPIAYDGFEPSGIAHLPVGIYRPLLLKQLLRAGVRVKLLLADSFAWINNKFEGDMEKIRLAGEYFVEVWKAAGVDMRKMEVTWHKELFDDPDYWKKVILISRNHSLTRTKRSLTIAGRGGDDSQATALVFYPSMQCADIFHLGADICQLGLDQRKVNMLARELAGKRELKGLLGYEGNGVDGKPVVVSHHMLMGLQGLGEARGMDDDVRLDREISSKMSKSLPETAIFVHDTKEEILRKMEKAFCPAKVVEGNPVVEYAREILFRAFGEVEVKREKRHGGDMAFHSYGELEGAYVAGELHPLDLKRTVAEGLDELIEPIRNHFDKDKKAKKLYENVKSFNVTR
ncbi:MAG: tyrosine--tRNA ligase [Candidatus Hydrothermarchaeales archaeon]